MFFLFIFRSRLYWQTIKLNSYFRKKLRGMAISRNRTFFPSTLSSRKILSLRSLLRLLRDSTNAAI